MNLKVNRDIALDIVISGMCFSVLRNEGHELI